MDKSGQDLWNELNGLIPKLKHAHAEMERYGNEALDEENTYDMEYSKAMLEEEINGTAVSLVEKKVKGREDISLLKLSFKKKDRMYKNEDKKIDSIKKIMTILNDQINREYRG